MADKSIIVVGVDPGEESRRALAWAASEALRRGSTLQLVTAWNWESMEGAPLAAADPYAMEESARAAQESAVAEVLDPMDPRPAYASLVVQSTAWQALVDASRTADLVVVGTHGRGPVRSFLLGSVSQSVIRHSSCPVVVLPPLDAETAHQQGDVVELGHVPAATAPGT
jgi:nucleotide-binding universal stress UspA family protein